MPLTYNQINGEFLGYPKCCISAFGDVATPFAFRPSLTKQAARNGFLPCESCAQKLLNKETTYAQLINPNRQCTVPFKEVHSFEESLQIEQELDLLE